MSAGMAPFCWRTPNNNNNMADASPPSPLSSALSLVPRSLFALESSLPQLLISQSGVCEVEELAAKQSLRLRIVAREMSLQRLSIYTPALLELDLSGSCLTSLRDLGCGLGLQKLRVRGCGLNCLDGVLGLPTLQLLDAAHNAISDVGPCAMLPTIQRIDLSNNAVGEVEQLSFLSLCSELRELSLAGCPVEALADYRQVVLQLLPELSSLDDQPLPAHGLVMDRVSETERGERKCEEEKEKGREEDDGEEDSDVDFESNAVVSKGKASMFKRQGTVEKMTLKRLTRPSTATATSTGTGMCERERARPRPQSAVLSRPSQQAEQAWSHAVPTSRLTSGVVVCGNLTAALRRSKQTKTASAAPHQTTSASASNSCKRQDANIERVNGIRTLLTASQKWRAAFVHYRESNSFR